MRVVVAGAAGFIGSAVSTNLVKAGHEVVGIDCLLEHSYPARLKLENVAHLEPKHNFELIVEDLCVADVTAILDGADVVINEAALAGTVQSWDAIGLYVTSNITATGRLLDAANRVGVERFLQVSTSSVYGRLAIGGEDQETRPSSPYGVTKLAAENMALAFHATFGLPVSVLRYFSVYGPRQRPDMGYHIFSEALLDDEEITIFGDGTQSRTNTYIDDCVAATVAAIEHGAPGRIYNIGGMESTTLLDAINILGNELAATPRLRFEAPRPGDQYHTKSDSNRAREELGWTPRVDPEEGLRLQADWHRRRRETA